jgi:hypothetical protein
MKILKRVGEEGVGGEGRGREGDTVFFRKKEAEKTFL